MFFGENTFRTIKAGLAALFSCALISCAEKEKLETLQQFQKVAPIDTMTLKINNYCSKDDGTGRFIFKELFVNNLSTVVDMGRLWEDIDRDGINPTVDNSVEMNLDFRSADTNGDGYSDLAMLRAGIDAYGQTLLAARPCADPNQDTDNDLISDCDENLLSLDKFNPDTDGDFIPDGLELRSGMAARDASDSQVDTDGDGYLNIEEVKMVTPFRETNTEQMSEHSYIYSQEVIFDAVAADCSQPSELTISNIPMMRSPFGNVIVVMFVEQLVEARIANDVINRVEIRKCEIFVSETEPDGFLLEGEYEATSTGFRFTTASEIFCD